MAALRLCFEVLQQGFDLGFSVKAVEAYAQAFPVWGDGRRLHVFDQEAFLSEFFLCCAEHFALWRSKDLNQI